MILLNTQLQERKAMNKINLRPFLSMNSDTLELRCASGLMQAAMVKARERQEEAAAEALADNLQKALNAHSSYVEERRSMIRSYKQKMAFQVECLKNADRARAYLEETGNPVPWFVAIKIIDSWNIEKLGVSYDEFRELSKIPDNWKPSAE